MHTIWVGERLLHLAMKRLECVGKTGCSLKLPGHIGASVQRLAIPGRLKTIGVCMSGAALCIPVTCTEVAAMHSAAAAACQGGHCHRAGWRCRQHLLCGGGRHLHSAQHPGEGQLLPWLALVPCTSCEWIVDTSFQSCRHCCETVTGKGTCGMCF